MTKLKLNLAQRAGEILTREELKKVLGGIGSGNNSGSGNICVANKDWKLNYDYSCFSTSEQASAYAGSEGYWCCNCQTAYDECAW